MPHCGRSIWETPHNLCRSLEMLELRDNPLVSAKVLEVGDRVKQCSRALGLSFVNWRRLRTSHATWPVRAGADVKNTQARSAPTAKPAQPEEDAADPD
jgi:hypothetical protein